MKTSGIMFQSSVHKWAAFAYGRCFLLIQLLIQWKAYFVRFEILFTLTPVSGDTGDTVPSIGSGSVLDFSIVGFSIDGCFSTMVFSVMGFSWWCPFNTKWLAAAWSSLWMLFPALATLQRGKKGFFMMLVIKILNQDGHIEGHVSLPPKFLMLTLPPPHSLPWPSHLSCRHFITVPFRFHVNSPHFELVSSKT